MDYNKIKKEINNKFNSVKAFFEKYPDILTEGGFYQGIEGNSMKVKNLEEISEKLNVPMTFWFEEEKPWEFSEQTENYNGISVDERKVLLKQINENLLVIDELRKRISEKENQKQRFG